VSTGSRAEGEGKMKEAASNDPLIKMLDSDLETAPGKFDNYRSVG
jgi:hypothetical protein